MTPGFLNPNPGLNVVDTEVIMKLRTDLNTSYGMDASPVIYTDANGVEMIQRQQGNPLWGSLVQS